MRQIILIACSVMLISAPASAASAPADEVLDQIKFAEKLYKDKKYNKAIKEFGFIINEIRSKLSNQFGKNFPAAQKGWRKGKVKSQIWA